MQAQRPCAEVGLGVTQALDQELIVPLLGPGVICREAESYEHGKPENVTNVDRQVECVIVQTALRSLHPVENATSFRIRRAGPRDPDPRLRCPKLL